MEPITPLFARLATEATTALDTAAARAAITRWASAEHALAGLATPKDVLGRCWSKEAPAQARATLAALVHLAGDEALAARLALSALAPILAKLSRDLSRSWEADPGEVDQAMAVAAWAAICRRAGTRLANPVAAIASPARDEVRGTLRTQARRDHRSSPEATRHLQLLAVPPATEEVEVAELFASALRRGVVSLDEARLVVGVRALGVRPAEAARARNRRPSTLRTQLCRAEAALRAAS
ncbi:MAG: hypothetical protein ACRDY2_07665 [Acidimicrobiales bacterium]